MSQTPSNATAWNTFYSDPRYSLASLPAKSSLSTTSDDFTQRDTYVQASQVLNNRSLMRSVYSDVLVFDQSTTVVSLVDSGAISLYTRVLTADRAILLDLKPATDDMTRVVVYASEIQKPFSFRVADVSNAPVTVISLPTDGVGFIITVEYGIASIQYLTQYDEADLYDGGPLSLTLQTQLRASNILFWLQPDVARFLTAHVALATSNSIEGAELNLQANAILKQLSVIVLGGSISYAPVLPLQTYETTLNGAIAVTRAFQQQYDRFVDRATIVADMRAAWDTMLSNSEDSLAMQQQLAQNAFAKWTSSKDILMQVENQMTKQATAVAVAEVDFRLGIEVWKTETTLQAIFNVFTALITFATAVGALAVGSPAAAGAPAAAASAVTTIGSLAGDIAGLTVSVNTMNNLKFLVMALSKLYDDTLKNVALVQPLSTDPRKKVTPRTDDSADSAALTEAVGIAAWDSWTLQTESNMAFAIGQKIRGASDYLLQLKKQAICGKVLCQARSQTVKAGQEYIQLTMAVHVTQLATDRLRDLRVRYDTEVSAATQAATIFYDRMLSLRTSVLIMMRNAVWAFKYFALQDSVVVLKPLKTIEDYMADSQMLVNEVTNWSQQFSSDPSRFTFRSDTSKLPLDYGSSLIESLKTTGQGSFTLSPTTGLAGPFVDGGRFRVYGMRAFLDGAKAKSPTAGQETVVTLRILTTGLYSDVFHGTVFNFTTLPLSRKFQYTPSYTVIDAISESESHMDPTPFTQWTIRLDNPADIDLSGLTMVKFEWMGEAYFD